MSVYVLLNFLNELRTSDKMRGLLSILSPFRNKYNEFNNREVRTLDSIYHITQNLLKNQIFGVKTSRFLPSFTQRYKLRHFVTR